MNSLVSTIESFSTSDLSLANINDGRPVCLEEGHYEVTICDYDGSGIVCYNLTYNGKVIIEGEDFGLSKTAIFDILFDSIVYWKSLI